jgi:hypothetical protein
MYDKKIKLDFTEKVKYFVKNFRKEIIGLIILILIIYGAILYNNNFSTGSLTRFSKNFKYAGNAVTINKRYFLTTYSALNGDCKINEREQRRELFLIFSNGEVYQANLYVQNEEKDLAIIVLDEDISNNINTGNYAIFPRKIDNLFDKNVYISRTKNSSKSSYRKFKVIGIADKGYGVKNNNFRKNVGEIVLNDKFEFVGIARGNTINNKLRFFENNVNFINQSNIVSYLRQNRVFYYNNSADINLLMVKNYLADINVKVVCQIRKRLVRVNNTTVR